MNTKPIPIIITLSASGICCVISILQGVPFSQFVLRFGVVAFVFFVIGLTVSIILIEAFGEPDSEKETEEVDAAPEESVAASVDAEAEDESEDQDTEESGESEEEPSDDSEDEQPASEDQEAGTDLDEDSGEDL